VISIDLPYFKPLVIFLKRSEKLKTFFGQKDFFLDPNIDVDEIGKAIDKNRPFRNIIWLIPGATVGSTSSQTKRQNCSYKGTHEFYITILTKCDRDKFSMVKSDEGLDVSGPVIDVMGVRKAVKDEIKRFYMEQINSTNQAGFYDLIWVRDNMIDYIENDKGCGFINATMAFNVEII